MAQTPEGLSTDGPLPKWVKLKLQKMASLLNGNGDSRPQGGNAQPLTALNKDVIVQQQLDGWRNQVPSVAEHAEYYLRGLKGFPDIPGYGRHGILTNWYFSAPFGQPRGVNITRLRVLAESNWISSVVDVRVDSIATLETEIKPIDRDNKNNDTIKDAKDWFDGPMNQNKESFSQVLGSFVRDIVELDAGVMVKTFTGSTMDVSLLMNTAVPKPFQKDWGEHIDRQVPLPAEGAGKDSAVLAEIFARDGASFLKDTDQYGILNGFWQYAYKYPQGKPIPFSPREIIYAMVHPLSYSPYGKCPLQTIQDVIDTLVNSVLHNKQFFGRHMVPPGLISVMGMSKDNFRAFKSYFNTEVRGRPHEIPLLNPGLGGKVDWVSFTPTARDLQFLETQQWYWKLVCAAFGVTFNEMGITDGLTRANAEEQSHVYKRRGINPMLRAIEYFINMGIIPELGFEGVKFQFVRAIDSQERTRLTNIQVQEIQTGLKLINEVRTQELGLEEVEYGDVPPWEHQKAQTYPFGAFPDNESVEEEEEPRDEEEEKRQKEKEEEEEAERKKEAKSVSGQIIQLKEDLKKDLVAELQKAFANNQNVPLITPTPTTVSLTNGCGTTQTISTTAETLLIKEYDGEGEDPLTDEFYELPNPAKVREDPRAISPMPLEREYQRDLKELFSEQRREILKALGRGALGLAAAQKVAGALTGKHFGEFVDLTKRFLFRVLQRGANMARRELKLEVSFNLEDPDTLQFIRDSTQFLAQNKFNQIRERIREIIIEALHKGEGVHSVAKSIKHEYSIQYTRAENIARTEGMKGFNTGRRKGYEKSGLVKGKQWIVTYDDRLCPICRPMANKTAGLKDYFVTNEGLRVLEPPVHPQCRCTITPILFENVVKTAKSFFTKTEGMKKIEERLKPWGTFKIEELLPAMYKILNMGLIGKALQVSKMTVSRWLQSMGVDRRPNIAEDPTECTKNPTFEKDSVGKEGVWLQIYEGEILNLRTFLRKGERLETALKRGSEFLEKSCGEFSSFDACVSHFVNDPDFKPKGKYKTKKEAAQALCAEIKEKGKAS